MKLSSSMLILSLSTSLMAGTAMAATGSTEVDAQKSFLDNLHLNIWGRISGPGIKNPISDKQPDSDGNADATSPMSLYQEFQISYDAGKVDPFILNRFSFQAFKPSSADSYATYLDPRVGIETGGFKLFNAGIGDLSISYVRADVQLPVTQGSRDAGVIMAPAVEVDLELPIKGTNFTLGTAYDYRHNILKKDAPGLPAASFGDNPKDGSVWAMAHVTYKFSDIIKTHLRYESSLYHLQGDLSSDLISDGSRMRIRVDINAIKNLSLRPFLVWNPRTNLGSTQIGMDISGTLF